MTVIVGVDSPKVSKAALQLAAQEARWRQVPPGPAGRSCLGGSVGSQPSGAVAAGDAGGRQHAQQGQPDRAAEHGAEILPTWSAATPTPMTGMARPARHERREQPVQRVGGEGGRSGGDEFAPAVRGDRQAGEPQTGPLPSGHRLRDESQGQRRGGEKT